MKLEEVKDAGTLKEFIRFPFNLYRGHPYWVPPLIKDELEQLSSCVHGHRQSFTRLWLCKEGQQVKGRIAAIDLAGESTPEGLKIGRFGWLDFVDDPSVARLLMTAAEEWLKSRGVQLIQGPLGFSNLDKAGMLIEGFDELPTISELYNNPYYPVYLDRLGYEKAADWISFEFEVPKVVPDKINQWAELIKNRYQVSIVKFKDTRAVRPYGLKLFELINETHREIHGFVPISKAQAEYYVDKYLPLIKKEFLCLIIDKDQNLIGYGISMPSFSRAFQKAGGKLNLWGLYQLWRANRRNNYADLYLIGIAEAWRNKGINALMFKEIMQAVIDFGVSKVESNPELEHNNRVQSLWKDYQYRQHKRRRCFKKILA